MPAHADRCVHLPHTAAVQPIVEPMPSPPPRPAAAPSTVRDLLQAALALGLHPFEARGLLAHVTGLRREQLIAFDDRGIEPDAAARFQALARERAAGEPFAYLVGEREFHARVFSVARGVLIPRPETELLVEFALTHAPSAARVLDLGTGSGAIAVSIAAERPDLDVTACEVSADALAIATLNNQRLAAGRVRLLRSDWYGALGDAHFTVIVANPPYIAAGDPHLERGDLRFEPTDALTDHADGLSSIRTIITQAPDHLEPEGWLAIEHGYDQAAVVRGLLEARGFMNVCSARDLAGIERMSSGRWPATDTTGR